MERGSARPACSRSASRCSAAAQCRVGTTNCTGRVPAETGENCRPSPQRASDRVRRLGARALLHRDSRNPGCAVGQGFPVGHVMARCREQSFRAHLCFCRKLEEPRYDECISSNPHRNHSCQLHAGRCGPFGRSCPGTSHSCFLFLRFATESLVPSHFVKRPSGASLSGHESFLLIVPSPHNEPVKPISSESDRL